MAKRGRVVNVRVSEAGYQRVVQVADAAGVTVSEAVRQLLGQAVARPDITKLVSEQRM